MTCAKLIPAVLLLVVPLSAHAEAGRSDRGHHRAALSDAASQAALQKRGWLNPHALSMRAGAKAVQQALASAPVEGALRDSSALRDPKTRALVTTSLATAVFQGGSQASRTNVWQHRGGGYGWVGPVFWPFASYDILDYALWGANYDATIWDYGYPDVHAGLFGLYAYDDLVVFARYLPHDGDVGAGFPTDKSTTVAWICGDTASGLAGLPVDAFRNALQPNEAQSAALDDLVRASEMASRGLRAACPAVVALTAPQRLAVMRRRVEAMTTFVHTLQPPLQKFYGLLDDAQKAQLSALVTAPAGEQSAQPVSAPGLPSVQSCTTQKAGQSDWPAAAINQSVEPTAIQTKSLEALKAAAAKASDLLGPSCQPAEASTPPARLAAVERRLSTMMEALNTVTPALDEFYGSLSSEQAPSFDVIGSPAVSPPTQMRALQQPRAAAAQASNVTSTETKTSSEPETVHASAVSHQHYVRHAGHFLHPVRMIGHLVLSLVR
jgi:hypothetical protein